MEYDTSLILAFELQKAAQLTGFPGYERICARNSNGTVI